MMMYYRIACLSNKKHMQRELLSINDLTRKHVRYLSSSWIDQSSLIPKKMKPYLHLMRADKQVGTLLLMWPCVWSTAIVAPLGSIPDTGLLLKFALGSFVMRSAGCIINDLWDKDYDKHVERTKNRPLAKGDVTIPEAFGLLGLNLSCGLAVLLSLNTESVLLGLLSMPLVIVYPLMKRFSNWPQLVLGLTFNWGALVGFTAASSTENTFYSYLTNIYPLFITNSNSTYTATADIAIALYSSLVLQLPTGFIEQALPLYFSGVCWTLIYDTLYGYQDRKNDAQIGLKSTALTLGDHPQIPLTILSVGLLGGLLTAGHTAALTYPYYIGTTFMWTHSLWQIWSADINDSKNLWIRFNSNKYSGGLLSLAIVAGHF